MPAFAGAIAQGADGVELDVMRCGSGELVVCHDEWLDRLSGLHWAVADTPWWKLSQVDVGTSGGFPPARIPLLDEVVELLPDTAILNIEIKCEAADDGGLSLAIGSMLTDRRLGDRAIVSSFNALCLIRLAQAYPRLRRGLLIDPQRAWIPQSWFWQPLVAGTSVHPHFSQVTHERLNGWHRQGLEVAVWTVDEIEEARRLRAMGVEWLITNQPGQLHRQLAEAA